MTRPNGFVIPAEDTLLVECSQLITACKPLFADPAITEVEWRPGKKKGKDKTEGNQEDDQNNENAGGGDEE